MNLNKNQSGIGFLVIMMLVTLVAFLTWYAISQGTDNSPEESAAEVIDKAQDTVDKANEAGQKAADQEIIDSAGGLIDSVNNR